MTAPLERNPDVIATVAAARAAIDALRALHRACLRAARANDHPSE